jgi:hypothetical protein
VIADPIQVALLVADALERCGISYLVAGSLASSITGEPRSTLGVDLLVAMTERQVEPLVMALGDEFYADRDSFPDAQQMKRRERVLVMTSPDRYLYVYTADSAGTGTAARCRINSGGMCWEYFGSKEA